jgi:hypothetical protein
LSPQQSLLKLQACPLELQALVDAAPATNPFFFSILTTSALSSASVAFFSQSFGFSLHSGGTANAVVPRIVESNTMEIKNRFIFTPF